MKRFLAILVVVLLFPTLSDAAGKYAMFLKDVDSTTFILVNKRYLTLSLVDPQGNPIVEYGIACGLNYGNKTMRGDRKTPEGLFRICQILDSSHLSHDFGDGKGAISGAYGPWFLRLDVPGYQDIAIHGTHLPESIGSRETEGCIRLRNEDVEDLKTRVYLGMPVIILPDPLIQSDMDQFFSNPQEGKDVFISYSRKDSIVAEGIRTALESQGISCFMDRDGLSGGLDFPKFVAKAILDCKVFLYLGSENARRSPFVQSEAAFALEKKPKEQILPCLIDGSVLPPSTETVFKNIPFLNGNGRPVEAAILKEVQSRLGLPVPDSEEHASLPWLWIAVTAGLAATVCAVILLSRRRPRD